MVGRAGGGRVGGDRAGVGRARLTIVVGGVLILVGAVLVVGSWVDGDPFWRGLYGGGKAMILGVALAVVGYRMRKTGHR
jgi:hypothetical protein